MRSSARRSDSPCRPDRRIACPPGGDRLIEDDPEWTSYNHGAKPVEAAAPVKISGRSGAPRGRQDVPAMHSPPRPAPWPCPPDNANCPDALVAGLCA